MWTTWNFFFAEPPYKFQVKFIFTLTPQPPMYKCFMSPHKSLFCMETNSFRGTWNGFYTLSNKKHKDKLMDMCVLTKCKRLESSVDSLVPSTYFDCSFHKVGVTYFSFNFNILLCKFAWCALIQLAMASKWASTTSSETFDVGVTCCLCWKFLF